MLFTTNEWHSLAARIDKLESQNRKWKLASILLGVVTASWLAMAAKPSDHFDPNVLRVRSVEAQDFILKDEDGQVYARLTLNPTNKIEKKGRQMFMEGTAGPALQFYDEKGNPVWTEPRLPGMIPAK
jgi:hypothetical protein